MPIRQHIEWPTCLFDSNNALMKISDMGDKYCMQTMGTVSELCNNTKWGDAVNQVGDDYSVVAI